MKKIVDTLHATSLPMNQIINYANQIAEGLQAAHEKGIVHRDIKSANIMLTDKGKIKIMDFGLAKFRGAARVTQLGTTVGTAAYMSPEQAKGEEVDNRSDIWSFGVVLYEMLTGELPFKGDYEQAVIYSIINEEPAELTKKKYDIPEFLKHTVKKLLTKNPDQRFQSMVEIIQVLKQQPKDTIELEKKDNKASSIAVLPFTDMSPSKDQDYFCEGIAEEILNSLSKIESLHVVSRTSSFLFKKGDKDVKEIGKLLNVKTVLEGSVRKAGNILRVNVQLTSVMDGFYLWSERYDRELEDIFAIQDDIAEKVATALRGVLTPEEKKAIRHTETVIEAYELFLKGRYFLNQIILEEAQELFEKVIKLDANYAPAYAGLAEVHCWLYEWKGSRGDDLRAAYSYSQKALELGPELAESHNSRGYVLSLDKNYEQSEKEFLKAIEINPNLFDPYYILARSFFACGEIEKSVELYQKAAEVNCEDFQTLILLAQSLEVLGLNKEAGQAFRDGIKRAQRQLNIDPLNCGLYL